MSVSQSKRDSIEISWPYRSDEREYVREWWMPRSDGRWDVEVVRYKDDTVLRRYVADGPPFALP